jgi:mitochondrial import inner membrane translocase subunit TIM23
VQKPINQWKLQVSKVLCGCAGAVLGGGQGAIGAVRTAPEIGPNTARLRLNRLLNMSGRTGRSAGNALGVLGLFFSSFESGLGYLADGRTPDAVNSVAAGT